MSTEDLQKQLESKKLKLAISRAQVSIEELEFKISEKELDIQRMREHIKLQQEIITNANKDLAK